MARGHHNKDEKDELAEAINQPDIATPDENAIDPEILEGEGSQQMVTIPAVELNRLNEEARSSKDKYLRALADSENIRKRMVKEKEDYSKFSVANTIVEFLQPLDNLEKALSFAEKGSDEVKNWALGFEMIITQFKDVLASHGVAPIRTNGVHFDPHLHEAVEVVETDDLPPGTILEEFTRGYIMGSRTIQPARVKVTRKPQAPAPAATPTEENVADEQPEQQ